MESTQIALTTLIAAMVALASTAARAALDQAADDLGMFLLGKAGSPDAIGSTASGACAAQLGAWRWARAARSPDGPRKAAEDTCDGELHALFGEARDRLRVAGLPASESTPEALARRFADELQLPGMPDLDRPVYLRSGSVICSSPGALRNPNRELTLMTGACAVIEAEKVRVLVYEPRDAGSYVEAQFLQSVRVAIQPRRISAADSVEGWVNLRSISND